MLGNLFHEQQGRILFFLFSSHQTFFGYSSYYLLILKLTFFRFELSLDSYYNFIIVQRSDLAFREGD